MRRQQSWLPVVGGAVSLLLGEVAAESNKLLTEDKWIGALTWTAITIILAGAAFAFLATDWEIWLGRERQKRWLAGIISLSLLTLVAIGLGVAGIIVAWANLQNSKNHKNTQDTYSAILALYLATYGFLIFYGFVFFNRKSLAWGVIFWLLALGSAYACWILMWWINTVAFGLFATLPIWLTILGIILFVMYSRNKEDICRQKVKVKHISHRHESSGPYGRHSYSHTDTHIAVDDSEINF